MTEQKQKKKALGKGLEALFGEISVDAPVKKPAESGNETSDKIQLLFFGI